jgi:DNA-3-methyladenine glycosylase
VARDLVGCVLVRVLDIGGKKQRLAGVIVETEAYGHADDPASHACRGMTRRNEVMFGRVGRAYVYFTYGAHYCVNVSARSHDAVAGAVLIRGIEPVEGVEEMERLRRVGDVCLLASGPGRLTQALQITLDHNGVDMTDPGSGLHILQGKKRVAAATARIGITKAADRPWRFIDPGSPFVSRKARVAAGSKLWRFENPFSGYAKR